MYEAIEACDTCEPLHVGGQSYCRDCGLRLATAEPSTPRRASAGRRSAGWAWSRATRA
ncbi:MAG: hypothetical protein M3P93_17975 [Actinomycetota bacterium]|nr:hypothetical protein [Actinomycetota bacterium]